MPAPALPPGQEFIYCTNGSRSTEFELGVFVKKVSDFVLSCRRWAVRVDLGSITCRLSNSLFQTGIMDLHNIGLLWATSKGRSST
jgi:hypothetical protein